MQNHCKSLIYSKLRGGVESRFPNLENDLRVVSVAPYYSIHSNKASATGPLGSVSGAFLVCCPSRHCEEARRSNPGTRFPSGMEWKSYFTCGGRMSLLTVNVTSRRCLPNTSPPFPKGI